MERNPCRTILWTAILGAAVGLLALGGCSGTSTPFDSSSRTPDSMSPAVPMPNAVAGDAQARGAAGGGSTAQQPATPLTRTQAQEIARRRLSEAEALWNRAVALEPKSPLGAATLFDGVVKRYPEYEKAAEARFRQARALYKGRAYPESIKAVREYMLIAPVNPHLAEVEEMLYNAGRKALGCSKGLFGLFGSDDAGLAALELVAESFPAGNYPDDALLALAQYYRQDQDYEAAALHYRELLIRYPDSEWSFRTSLALADTYMERDRGTPYNAGFVMVDPRESIPAELALQMGPIDQALWLALEQYQLFLDRMDADPARASEYRCEIDHAKRRAQEARERIAGKHLDRGNWYQSRGDPCGAITYYRLAAYWPTTRAGKIAAQRVQAAQPARATQPVRRTQ